MELLLVQGLEDQVKEVTVELTVFGGRIPGRQGQGVVTAWGGSQEAVQKKGGDLDCLANAAASAHLLSGDIELTIKALGQLGEHRGAGEFAESR